VFLKHELFKEFIRDWQDVAESECGVDALDAELVGYLQFLLKDVLIETCPNKIFLPNPEATSETVRVYYEMLGVNARRSR